MPEYKLTYFKLKGLGEPIRFILSYGGADFEDIRIDHLQTWPDFKSTVPFGQLPILEIDGRVYHQTLPICRYLAKRFNIGGKTDLDALEIDAIVNSIHDLRKCWLSTCFITCYWDQNPVEKAKKRESILNVVLLYYMSRFDDLVKKNGGYFHGEELTYADLFFAALYEHMNAFMRIDVIKDFNNLKQLMDKVYAIPSIAAWIAKRPVSEIYESPAMLAPQSQE